MTVSLNRQLDDCCQAFAESFEVSNLPVMREVERAVLGCDYGGTSWTTNNQAKQIIGFLDLGPGVHLLDIGAGSGWPGVFLADKSGCEVTLLDLPFNALVKARDRARADGIHGRVNATVGSGAALPFPDASFVAISHSDVLCCLPQKIEMLRECRRVARDSATMLFSVISIAKNLPDADYRRAIDVGPPFIDAPKGYGQLLRDCGWRVTQHLDVTSEYRNSLGELARAFETSGKLCEVLGKEVVEASRKHRLDQLSAIDAGLMIREIFLATVR